MQFTRMFGAILASTVVLCPSYDAQTLVKDFNTASSTAVIDSNPGGYTALLSGDVLFGARAPDEGNELWISDGSVAGTQLLMDLEPGQLSSNPHQFTALPNGTILFTASTSEFGWELWTSDGTVAGTSMVKDIRVGAAGSVGTNLTAVGSDVFFLADDGISGIELWKSDGTSAGTVMVADLVASGGMSNGTAELTRLNANEVVFSALINQHWELWKSDGTATGTTLIYNFNALLIDRPVYLTPFGSKVLFLGREFAGDQTRWVTDGTSSGTFSLGIGGAYGPFLVAGSTAYFEANDFATGLEPWMTDGTIAGTTLVADIAIGTGFGASSNPTFIGTIGSDVIFSASTAGNDYDLYVSDGTPVGTSLISGVGTGLPYSTSFGGAFGSDLFFLGDDGTTEGMWRTDGTAAGTSLFSNAHPLTYRGVANVNGTTLFTANDLGQAGTELWTTDGTTVGTQLFKDLAPAPQTVDSDPYIVASFPDKAFVLATDSIVGRELFVSDGTTAGTQLLIDLEPGMASASSLKIATNDRFAFFSSTSTVFGDDPWVTDGTPAGTSQLPLSGVFPGFKASAMVQFGDRIVFSAFTTAHGHEPWITDGTMAGTHMLADVNAGAADAGPASFKEWNGKVFFTAASATASYEPWVTDGTSAGTMMLADTVPGTNGYYAAAFVGMGDHVYFTSSSYAPQGAELWRSDGTPGGTNIVADLAPGSESSNPYRLVRAGDHVVFLTYLNDVTELYSTDGTSVQQLNGGSGDFAGPFSTGNDSAGYFRLATAAGGLVFATLWETDGTQGGTSYNGYFPEFSGSTFTQPKVITDDGFLLHAGSSPSGSRMWTSDGTVAGTRPVLPSLLLSTYHTPIVRLGDRVLFQGNSSVYGTELFSFPLDLLGDEVIDHVGYGVAGTNGVPTIDIEGEADASATAPFELVVGNALASSTAIMAWSRDTAAIALPSVTLWTGGTVNALVTGTDLNGRGSFSFTPNPSLAGQRFVAQVFVVDPLGTAFGIASATRGLELVVGP